VNLPLPRAVAPARLPEPLSCTGPNEAFAATVCSMIIIGLVSCVKTKRSSASPAADLYVSPLFTRMRRYAENHCDAWFVLSAKYGVLPPGRIVAPYELTLNTLAARDREEWAARVRGQLERVLPPKAHVILLAGERYRAGLVPWLSSRKYAIEVPMAGMRMGEQLKWLKQNER
jgi:hypothetical protein